MITKDLKTCEKLLSISMNEVISRYFGTEDLKTYAWGFRDYADDYFTVGNNHGNNFHFLNDVVKICEGCGVRYFLTIGKDADGEPTPVVHIF